MEEALRFKQENEVSHSTDGEPKEMRVRQLLLLFKKERPDSFLFHYKARLVLQFTETFGDFYAHEVSEPVVDAWMHQLAQDRGLLLGTVAGEMCSLNYFFRYLVEKGVIEKSPITGIGKPWSKKIRPRLSAEEADQILSESKRLSPGYLYPMVLLARESKAKPEEIYAATWKNVDLARKTISFERYGYLEKHRMSDELHAAICNIKRTSLLLFVSHKGRPVNGSVFHKARLRARKHSSFKEKWTLEDLSSAEDPVNMKPENKEDVRSSQTAECVEGGIIHA